MEFIILFIIIEILIYISVLICFKLNIFINKLRFLVSSIFIALIFETLTMIISRNINLHLAYIFIIFSSLCILFLFLFRKINNLQFSILEYIYAFILYIIYEIIFLLVIFSICDI